MEIFALLFFVKGKISCMTIRIENIHLKKQKAKEK